jgi:hypothetical protein
MSNKRFNKRYSEESEREEEGEDDEYHMVFHDHPLSGSGCHK